MLLLISVNALLSLVVVFAKKLTSGIYIPGHLVLQLRSRSRAMASSSSSSFTVPEDKDSLPPLLSRMLLHDGAESMPELPPSLLRLLRYAKDGKLLAPTKVDWLETPDEHVFQADMPGLTKNEIRVVLDDDRVLKISGERKRVKEETTAKGKYRQLERNFFGSFERKVLLPENADVHQIQAKMENGVLTIIVLKVKKSERVGRSIQIA